MDPAEVARRTTASFVSGVRRSSRPVRPDNADAENSLSESQHALLRKYGIRPVKRRGQNFLVDGNLARAIAQDTLAISDRVLELGAGGGALTVHLLAGAARVVCVEVDRHLCGLLRAEFGAAGIVRSHRSGPGQAGLDRRCGCRRVRGRSSPAICPTF